MYAVYAHSDANFISQISIPFRVLCVFCQVSHAVTDNKKKLQYCAVSQKVCQHFFCYKFITY